MKVLIHDYAGYPFPVQLSRSLARRGNFVLHLYAGHNNTPMGSMVKSEQDAVGFQCEPIFTREPLQKYSFTKRWFQEQEYQRHLARRVSDFCPQAVLSCNGPNSAHVSAYRISRKFGTRFVFWWQDLNGIAADKILSKKIPLFGKLLGRYFIQEEKYLVRNSDRVIVISEDFFDILKAWKIETGKVQFIPNWAPIEYLPVRPKINPWSATHGLADKFCFLYSGSLGLKHNPDLLLQLALQYRDNQVVCVVVISEGLGADWLKQQVLDYRLNNLVILGYQPFEDLADVFAAADVLVGILQPEAGAFSVPSKTLAYLCAQRPLLLAVPPENLAGRIVTGNQAGLVVPPQNGKEFIHSADKLLADSSLRQFYGHNARIYAEQNFDIGRITEQFENILLH